MMLPAASHKTVFTNSINWLSCSSMPSALTMCLMSLIATSSLAEQKPEDSGLLAYNALETMVVTGTRTEHAFIEAPVKVEVVTQEELQQQHAFDLSEGLKTIPGIQLKSVTGKEGLEAWIQGISANRVLVLIDGEPVSASTGSTVDLTQIVVTDVQRIEVVKGASSVLYGSQAMGGVINVITAQPEAGLHGRLSVDGGSYGDRNSSGDELDIARERYAGQLSYGDELFYLKADFNLRYSDGFKTDPESWRQEGPDGHRNSTSFLAGFTPSDDQLYTIRYENYDQELHSQLLVGRNQDDKIDNAQRDRLSLKGDWTLGKHNYVLKGFHEEYETQSMPSRSKERNSDMPMSQADFQWGYSINDLFTLTSGASLFQESLYQESYDKTQGTTPEVDDESRSNQEIFSQLEAIANDWSIVPGIRVQQDSDFGSHISPKISVRHDTTDSMFIRFSMGDGYRVPNLKERYYVFDHSHIGYMIIGNPDLKPEKSLSQQFSLVFTDYQRYQAEIGLFRNDLSDLIETTPQGFQNNVQIYEYTNVAEAITQGIEISGSYSFTPELKIGGGYTYLYSKDVDKGHELNDRPENQIKANLSYLTPWDMDISFIVNWQDKAYQYSYDVNGDLQNIYETDAWSQLDLKLTQLIFESERQTLNIYGGIDNITDEIKEFSAPFDNRPEVGRVVYMGVAYEF